MIRLIVVGQELSIVTKKVVAGTHDYLTVKATFKGDDWTDLRKWVHFTMGEDTYIIPMTDDAIGEEMHLDLTEGTWEVYVHGNELEDDEVTQRITTDVKYLYVEAPHDGHPFPPLTPTYEELLANLIMESNDIWTRLWIAASNGALGGPYYVPSIDENGVISWTNNGGRENPEPRSVRGPKGLTGNSGVYFGTEEPTDPDVNVWVNPEGAVGKVISGYEMTGDHTPGSYDHLIWKFSDNSELDIPIYNGVDGEGSGDMSKDVYDPNNHATDIFATITSAIAALASVARSGSYNDLSNKPTIPVVDSSLSGSSTNAIQNKVVKAALDNKQNIMTVDTAMSGTSTNTVQNKAIKQYVDSKVTFDTSMSDSSNNAVRNNVIKSYVDSKSVTVDTAMSGSSNNAVRNSVIKNYVDGKTVVDTAMSDSSNNAVRNSVIKSYVDTQVSGNFYFSNYIHSYTYSGSWGSGGQHFTISKSTVAVSGYTLIGILGAQDTDQPGGKALAIVNAVITTDGDIGVDVHCVPFSTTYSVNRSILFNLMYKKN